MLNRNGLFGGRDEKLDEKNKGLGPDTYGAGSLGSRGTPTDPNAASASGLRAARDTNAPAAAAATAAPAAKTDDAQGSRLIVGPNIKLKGVEITDCDTLVVEGHVEATMDSRAIQISQSGSFSGTVGIDVAEIRGSFSGELTVRKKLVIYSTGKVSGKVRYGKLVIEEGGELSGEIKMLAQGQEQPAVLPAPKNAPGQPAIHH